MWEGLGDDADPGVADANEGLTVVRVHANGQLTAGVGVLGSVGEQVHEHLLQAAGVALQPYGSVWQSGGQAVMALLDSRLERLDGAADDEA